MEECLKKEPRTYNSLQLDQKEDAQTADKMESRQVNTGTLKKGVISKRSRKSHKGKQDIVVRESKQADLDRLELATAEERNVSTYKFPHRPTYS